MKHSPPLLSILAGVTLAVFCQSSGAERIPRRAVLQPTTGEVIVSFRSDASMTRMHALAAQSDSVTTANVLAQRATTLGARIGRVLEAGAAVSERAQVVRASGVDAVTLAAQLAADPEVEFAVPNGRKRLLAAPNDPLYLSGPPVQLPVGTTPGSGGPVVGQWYLRATDATVRSSIDIESAWAQTSGDASVVVAVLDTGVRKDHADLAGGHILQGYDFISDPVVANDSDPVAATNSRDGDPSDPGDWITPTDVATGSHLAVLGCTVNDVGPSSWHGTTTASLIGAATNNGIGMAGAAPGVSVLPLRVLGKCGGSDVDIQAAMLWAVGIHVPGVPDNTNPAKVLNMSLGAPVSPTSPACDLSYQSVVNQVLAKGAVIVVAAGNSNGLAVGTPANCTGVIAVAGLRHVGTKVGFSDLGPQIALAAPAGNCVNIGPTDPCQYPILAATNTGAQGPAASAYTDSFNASLGTSFSAPLVAATAALMFSAQPALTPASARAALQSSARPFPTSGVAPDPVAGPIVACHAPTTATQDQCYCGTSTCGAGMLDAGAAVRAAIAVGAGGGAGSSSGSGGGAMAGGWLLALLLATAALLLPASRRR